MAFRSKASPRKAPRVAVAVLRRQGMADLPVPREYLQQRKLFRMLKAYGQQHPDLLKMFAVPNGGSRGDPNDRSNREGMNLKLEGVTPGVPNTCLPVPRLRYHGLYIEMKRVAFGMGVKWGTFGEGQVERLRELRADGYYATIGMGHNHALKIALAYIASNQNALDERDQFEAMVQLFQEKAPKTLADHLRT